MQKHLSILGILHIVMGMMALAGVLLFFTIFSGFSAELQRELATRPDGLPFDPVPVLRGFMLFFGLYGALEVAAGIGVLDRAGWSRLLSMVLGAIGLVSFPFGTALGIYTFWVMLDDRTKLILEGVHEPAA